MRSARRSSCRAILKSGRGVFTSLVISRSRPRAFFSPPRPTEVRVGVGPSHLHGILRHDSFRQYPFWWPENEQAASQLSTARLGLRFLFSRRCPVSSAPPRPSICPLRPLELLHVLRPPHLVWLPQIFPRCPTTEPLASLGVSLRSPPPGKWHKCFS